MLGYCLAHRHKTMTNKKASENCLWCQKPARYYCDEWIGGGTRDGLYSLDEPQFTCDAPCCHVHAHQIGHMCGKRGDSIDKCEYHHENPVTIFHPRDLANNIQDVEKIRRLVAASARRKQFKAV